MSIININELREYLAVKELTVEEFFYLKNVPKDNDFKKSLSLIRDSFNDILKSTKKIKNI